MLVQFDEVISYAAGKLEIVSYFVCLLTGHRHNTCVFIMAQLSSAASLANLTFCYPHKFWCNLIGAAHFPMAAYSGFERECYKALSHL